MILRFESDGLELIGRLSKPEKIAKGHETGLILCHGFPSLSTGDNDIAKSYYDLADLISEQLGWTVFAITLRGSEKARLLKEWLGEEPAEIWGYGNSRGDREMLAMADHQIWVK